MGIVLDNKDKHKGATKSVTETEHKFTWSQDSHLYPIALLSTDMSQFSKGCTLDNINLISKNSFCYPKQNVPTERSSLWGT